MPVTLLCDILDFRFEAGILALDLDCPDEDTCPSLLFSATPKDVWRIATGQALVNWDNSEAFDLAQTTGYPIAFQQGSREPTEDDILDSHIKQYLSRLFPTPK